MKMIQTSNPESKDFIKDLSNESVVDLSNKISFDQEKFKSPEDISKKDKLLASLQDIIEAKTDASALNSDLEHIFEVFLNSAAISTLPQNPTFGEILAAFDTWKCPANVALNYAAVDIKNYVCDLLELNDQKQQEIIKVVADAKNSEKTVEKKVLSRTENLLQTKIDANNQKIAELENLIINHKSTIQATIEREEAKGKTFTQKQIDDYKKSLEPTLEGRKKELQNLKAENVQLSADLHNAEFLENDEAHVQQYLSQLETATDDTTTKAELVGHQNAGADYANIKNKTKKDSKALKWMRDGKGGIDPVGENLSKEDQKDLKNLSTIVNRIDLQHAVDFMDKYRNLTSSQATKEQWTQKIKENFSKDYAMKNRGLNALFHSQEKAVYEFANYYFDYHKGNASQTPVNQFMLQLLSGARAEMSVVDIYNNKRLIDVVVDGLTKDKTTAEKQGEQSQKNEWLSSSEEALVRLLGDTNMDGRVVGVAGQKQTKKEQLDASNIFGTQIMSAYNAAKVELSIQNSDPKIVDQILIKNLFSLILNNPDKIYRHNQELNFKNFLKQKGFTSDGNGGYNVPESIQNFDDVLQFFSKDPALFNVLKKSVNGSHEYLVQAFTYGAKYADHHLQREKDVRWSKQEPEEGFNSNSLADAQQQGEAVKLPEEFDSRVEGMISAEYEKYIVGLHQDLEKQKIDLEKQIKEEKDPAKKDELQSQLKALKSPKLKESIALLNDPTQKEQAKKGFKVNLVGLLYQHYELNEQPAKKSLSAALNVTHEGFNDWLAKNTATIIQNFSLSGGIGLDKQGDHYQPVLGLAATVSGKQGLREGGSLIYAGGVGAGRNGNWAVGPFVALGVEQQILSGTSNKKIDAGAAHYLGIIGNASAAGLGVSAYWRRDKLEGIENQSKKVQGKFSEIITQATTLQPNESLTIKGIEAQLKKQYPDQKGSLLPFASDIYTALKPYEEILKTEKNTPARQRVIDQLAYHMTTHWLNNNTAKLTEKFRHLSGIALGAQFVTGWYPMPTMGLSFTKYKNLSYTDSLESLNRAAETLTQGYGADQIKGMSFGEMADNLNATLQRRYASTENAGESVEKTDQTKYLEYDSANNIVKINKKILEKVNLHILPVLKQFVAHQNWDTLYVPADIPVSYVSAVNAKDTKFHLILGTVGSLNTEVITAPSFSRFQPYDSDKFALRRQVLGEIPMTANGVETEQHLVKIDQKFLQDRITGAQLLNKIKWALTGLPGIDARSLKFENIGDTNFGLTVKVNGVDKKFTIPYDKLGTLQFLDNSGREPAVSSDLIFEEAKTPAEDVLPQLKIEKMKWEEIITDKWDTIVPESLEKTVTKEVLEYFRGWESSDVIISFRTKNKTAFDNFYKFVEAGGKENYAKAAKLFHDYLTSKSLATNATITSEIKNAFVADNGMLKGNVDFIYGALSRVRKTQDKQFGTVAKGEDQEKYMEAAKNKLVDTANDLIDNASKYGGLTLKGGKNKEELKALVKTRIIENPANTDTFTKLLAVIGNPSNKSTPNNVNDRLRFMLADFKELIGTRDASFVSRLKNEKINGKKISSVAVTEMTDARKAVKDTLNFPFDNAKEWKGVGLVFGYDHGSNGGGHHEKFINSPLIIQKEQKNLEPLTNPDTKEYFLRNLANFQKEDNALAQTAKNINLFIKEKLGIEGKVTMEQIINYLVNPKSPLKFDKDPKNHLEITLDTNFQFAFFADCINESILMGPIKINPSWQTNWFDYKKEWEGIDANSYKSSKGGAYLNATSTVINAHSERKDVVVGAVYGEERKPNRDSGHTEIKDESSKTEVKDIDLDETQLSKLDQPGVDVDLWGGYIATTAEDGSIWVVGPDLPTDGILATVTADGITFPLPSTPNAGVSVDQVAPTPTTNTKINSIDQSSNDQSSNMAADALAKKVAIDKK